MYRNRNNLTCAASPAEVGGTSFSVHRCYADFVRGTIEHDHYLHRYPDPRSLPFAYCLSRDSTRIAADGRPLGIVVMKKLQHHKQRGLFGYDGLPTAWQVLDLARVWIHPDLQSVRWQGTDRRGAEREHTLNVFSRMVSAVLRRVQVDWLEHHPPVFPELPYHIELIISYCELEHHDGTGYRAANFERWPELTRDRTKEIYFRRLRAPRFTWSACQSKLFESNVEREGVAA
jgi:hypothetical protein